MKLKTEWVTHHVLTQDKFYREPRTMTLTCVYNVKLSVRRLLCGEKSEWFYTLCVSNHALTNSRLLDAKNLEDAKVEAETKAIQDLRMTAAKLIRAAEQLKERQS